MNIATMEAKLQLMADELAALWVEADEAAKSAPRFSALRNEMLIRRDAFGDAYRTMIALNSLAGVDFMKAEGARWRAMTSERHLTGADPKGRG